MSSPGTDSSLLILLLRKNPTNLIDMDAPGAQQDQSRLMSLPPELRNHIWELVLVQPQVPPINKSKSHRFCANVLRTCKQIHRETLPILYGGNIFQAHSSLLATLPSFLLTIRPTQSKLPPVTYPRLLPYIRRFFLSVRLDTDPRFTRSQATECFTGAEEFEMEVFQPVYDECDFTTLSLFEGVRGVGKAIVRGSVGDGKYCQWLAASMMSPLESEVACFGGKSAGNDRTCPTCYKACPMCSK